MASGSKAVVLSFLSAFAAFAAFAPPPAAAASCFSDCLAETKAEPDDERAWRDAARACKARCEAAVRDDLARRGTLARVESCRAEPLTTEEMRTLRSANPSFQIRFNVFTWEIRNVLPGKTLRSIEVASPNLELQETRYAAGALIPPGGAGTFVIPDFYDGYPALRLATKVVEIGACAPE